MLVVVCPDGRRREDDGEERCEGNVCEVAGLAFRFRPMVQKATMSIMKSTAGTTMVSNGRLVDCAVLEGRLLIARTKTKCQDHDSLRSYLTIIRHIYPGSESRRVCGVVRIEPWGLDR